MDFLGFGLHNSAYSYDFSDDLLNGPFLTTISFRTLQ